MIPLEFTDAELRLIQEALDAMNGGPVSLDRHTLARLEDLWQKIDTELDHRDA